MNPCRHNRCSCRVIISIAACCLQAAAGSETAPRTEVYIRSEPPGASVAINGKTAGVTPLTIPSLPPGRHLVALSQRGYRPLYRTIDYQPDQRTVLDFKLDPLTGLLLIHTTPPAVELQINGVHRGVTPALVSDLPPGLHHIDLSLPGFLPRRLDVVIEDRQPKRIHTDLTPDTAVISITTEPAGSIVFVDGIRQGITPCRLENIRTGEIALSLTAAGYHPFSETLSLRAGEQRDINITLTPESSSLRITTTPPGARIFVNERFRGRAPVDMANVDAGAYHIRAELDAHDTATRSVQIGRGHDHVEEIPLAANAGRIEITTEPAGTQVLLDGVAVGETAPEPGKTDNISARFILPLVPAGTHELLLTRAGYYPLTQPIRISRNETHTAHYSLERRFIPNVQVQTRTETYRGVLTERNPDSLRLELRPGVFKTIQQAEITGIIPLRSPAITGDEAGENTSR